MGAQVKVSRKLEFMGEANLMDNIKGNPSPEKCVFVEHFVGKAIDTTNDCTTYLDTNSVVAVTPGATATGIMTMTTIAESGLVCSYAGQVVLYCAMNPILEWRFNIDDIANVRIVVGMNDETSEATDVLPFAISGTNITPVCSNGVHFVFDTDQDSDRWYVVNRKGGGTSAGTLLGTSYTPAADTFVMLRIALDTLGNATFFYNGKAVAYKALATTTTVGLCPYIGIRNANATAHVVSADYYKIWGD